MSGDQISDFFDELARRGHEPLLEKMDGRVAIELGDGGENARWVVSVRNGDIGVERGDGNADCTLRTTTDVFAALATGRASAMAAFLRGALAVEGDIELLAFFQRIFPGPPHDAAAPPVGSTTASSSV
jgi:predicted lipid carrier protein YhbT